MDIKLDLNDYVLFEVHSKFITYSKFTCTYTYHLCFFQHFRQEYGKTAKERQTLSSLNYDPRHMDNRTRNEEHYQQLCSALQNANPTCGLSKYVHKDPESNSSASGSSVQVQSYNDHLINDHPPSINQIKSACIYYKNNLKLNSEERSELENKTKDQSNSKAWYSAREHRLTASNFHRIGSRRKSDPSKLLNNLLYSNTKPTKAMAFGLEQESHATERFLETMKEKGKRDFVVERKGFIVHEQFSYIGASVDGVVHSTNETYVLELKNPLSTWDSPLLEAAKKLPCLKCDENCKISLNRKHSYYTQIQGQMAILEIPKCYFVLCTNTDIFVEEVGFDVEFWNALLEKLQNFYDNIFLPEIVYPSVKFGLPALDLGSL